MKKQHTKFSLLFLTLTSLVGLASCGPNIHARLSYGAMFNSFENTNQTTKNNYTLIDGVEFQRMNALKETYLLVTMSKSGTSCGCFSTLSNVIKPFIATYDIPVYVIPYQEMLALNDYQKQGVEENFTYLTFNVMVKGSIKYRESEEKKHALFTDAAAFEKYVFSKVQKPTIYHINKEILDQFIATENQEIMLYFGRNSCGDCTYVETDFLNTYVPPNDGRIYKIDGDTLGASSDETEDIIAWQKFKADYGLDSSYNPDFGYEGGFVPTFQLIKTTGKFEPASYVQDAVVYLNDALEMVNEKVIVTRSFYTAERLKKLGPWAQDKKPIKGIEVRESDYFSIGYGRFYWDKKRAAEYHDPFLKAFLDYYL